MAARGKLIAIEGVDGAGKRTQTDLLCKVLKSRGISFERFGFPQYESSFGRLVARFLNGDFGSLEAVDPHLSALLYAGDRFEAKPALECALAAGKTIVTDRYIASNLAHQTARISPNQRAEFSAWLRNLEYGIYGLPVEDLVLYIRIPAREGQERVIKKHAREYTDLKQDLQEASLTHLEEAAAAYDQLATQANWVTIECLDPALGETKPASEIHRAILEAVDARLLLPAAKS